MVLRSSPAKLIAAVLLLGLAGLAVWTIATSNRLELPVIRSVPGFALIDQHGQPVSEQTLRGRNWVAAFIYTRCPGPCPRVVEQVKRLQSRFQDEPDMRFVLVSVDPEHDTPRVLSDYAVDHDLTGDQWMLLSGDSQAVRALVRDGFTLGVSRNDADADGAAASAQIRNRAQDGPITHSLRLVLVDARGRLRGYYNSTEPEDVAELRAAIAKVLAEH